MVAQPICVCVVHACGYQLFSRRSSFINSIIYDEVIARLTSVTNITGAGKLAKMLLGTILILCLTGFAGKNSVHHDNKSM